MKRYNKNNDIFPRTNGASDVNNNYFSSLAEKYSKASHILYIALAVCFILTLIFNSRILTYNNFSYLFKDFNTAAEIASSNYNSISYSNDKFRTTKNFRGGIITASTTDMAIYNATGKKSLMMHAFNPHSDGTAECDFVIKAGDIVNAENRIILEIMGVGRCTPLYVSIPLFG